MRRAPVRAGSATEDNRRIAQGLLSRTGIVVSVRSRITVGAFGP